MSRAGSADEVRSFLQETRAARERTQSELVELRAHRAAAAERLERLRPHLGARTDLLDELMARDEELAAVDDELRSQVASLEHACALLERERGKYLDLFVNAPDAYIVTDLAGITQEANLRAAGMFSVAPPFLAGRPLIGFVARQDTRVFRSLLKDMGAADGAVRSATIRMRPRGQMPFVVAARVAVVRSSSGLPIAARWSLRQLSAQEVKRAAWLVDSEMARVLQDLRDPLASIQRWVRSLREGHAGDEQERDQALAWIEKTAAEEQVLLDELAELADLGAEPIEKQEVDLGEQLRAVIAVVAPEIVLSQWPQVPLRVNVRADLLRRSLVLLLRRAIEGLPQKAWLPRVRALASGGNAVVVIEAQEGALAPSGWNVRLAIAARIAESHGGRLVLREEHPTAELHLPLTGAPTSKDDPEEP